MGADGSDALSPGISINVDYLGFPVYAGLIAKG